jgi:hypothetical protein
MPSPDKEEEEASLLEQGLANLEQLDVMENDERKAGAGGKAAVDLPKLAVAEDGQVMVLLDQECISEFLKLSPRPEALPFDYSVEALRAAGFTDEQRIQTIATAFQALQLLWDIKNDIIQQYLDKGYAYVRLFVFDSSKQYALPAGNLPPLP